MEGYKCTVGKGVLRICMGDNYTDANVVFREYVQNAIDAIYQAQESGILSKNYVDITTNGNSVQIMDEGIGVKAEEIGPILIDLGSSTKTNSDIGQYGIGRLAGANWCDKIIFETSYSGEAIRSIVTFDAKKARDIVNNNDTQDCGGVMDEVTSYEQYGEDTDKHYFHVTLENVKQELCDEETIRNYLSTIAPIPYDDLFLDDCQKKAFQQTPEFESLSRNEKICKIHLNGKPIVKPYTSTIYIGNEALKITPPSFFKLTDEDYGDLAWGWYAINEAARQMGDNVYYKGLRLRAKNMAVGNQDYLTSCFKNRTDANYIIGEVFIIHKNIQPTGSRDGIKSSKEYTEFIARLKKKCKQIATVYNAASKLGSAGIRPYIDAKQTIHKNSFELRSPDLTAERKTEIQQDNAARETEIENDKIEIENKVKAINAAENTELFVETCKKYWNKEAKKIASYFNAKVPYEERIDTLISNALKKEGVTETHTPQDPETQKVSIPKTEIVQKETDIYKHVKKSGYKIMKIVYQVIDAEKNLDPKTKDKLKEKLKKKILSE